MTLGVELDRDDLVERLALMSLDWGDEEEAIDLVDVLLRRFSVKDAWCWILFRCPDLDGTPLDLIQQGRSRDVLLYARGMVRGA